VNTATERHGVRRTQTSTVPLIIRDSSVVVHVLAALTSLLAAATGRVLSVMEHTSAAQCHRWTATTTRTSAVWRVRNTTPASKVLNLHADHETHDSGIY